jgi:CelD/BcsL family acetyltransferase involved in cellulose biosynthesis
MSWKFEWITEWDTIYTESFHKVWFELAENGFNSHVFFHPPLCLAWIATYRKLQKIEPLFCFAEKGTISILFPLVLWTQNWKNAFRKIIVPVGYSDFDYHDPLTNRQLSKEDWASFYKSLRGSLILKVPFDAIEINGIRAEINSENWSKEIDIASFCELNIFRNSDDFLKSLKTSLRGDIRRQIKRISEHNPLTLNHYTTISEALSVLPHFLKLHSERWPKAYKAPGFHQNLIKYGVESGIIHFTSLKSGEKILSYHLGFVYNSRYYYYMPTIDPVYENLSPGKVHLFKLVEFAIENGYQLFDHLRGVENYKVGWTNSIQPLYQFLEYKNSPRSDIKNMINSIKKKVS